MELTTRRNVDKKHGLFEELCRRVGLYVENDTCFRMFLGKISLYHWEKQCFMVNMKCRDQNRLQLACVGISCLSLEEEIHSWKFWMQINAFILCYGWIWSPLGYLYYLITRCEEEDRIPASPTAYRAFKLHNPGKSKSLVIEEIEFIQNIFVPISYSTKIRWWLELSLNISVSMLMPLFNPMKFLQRVEISLDSGQNIIWCTTNILVKSILTPW